MYAVFDGKFIRLVRSCVLYIAIVVDRWFEEISKKVLREVLPFMHYIL